MSYFIYAEKDAKGKICFQTDNLKLLSELDIDRIKQSYFHLVFNYVKRKLREKGDYFNEKG